MSAAGRLAFALLPALALLGCSLGTGGDLRPTATQDVTASGDAATVGTPPLSAVVTARWTTLRGQSMTITYTNGGTAKIRVDLTPLKMTHRIGDAILDTAVDMTGVDMTDRRTDNDDSKVLFERTVNPDAAAVLDIPAGATRIVDAHLSPFTVAEPNIAVGDRVEATVPLAGRTATISFTAVRPPFSL